VPQVSYADFALFNALNTLVSLPGGPALLAAFPLVQQLHQTVGQRPRVKAYAARNVYAPKKAAL
jgi:hypothetical protein